MSIYSEDSLSLHYKRHRLISPRDVVSIGSCMDFGSFQTESKQSLNLEYLWFLENECLFSLQVAFCFYHSH